MLRILLIDDNDEDRALAIRELNQEFSEPKVTSITGAASLAQALVEAQFDLVITEQQLGWSDGLAVLHTIKAHYPDCPVVMFTKNGTQEIAVQAMKAGLDDYVVKSPQQYFHLAIAVRLAWKRTEERRRAARLELQLQSLLNRLDLGVFRASLDGQLLEANAAFLQMFRVKTLEEARSLTLTKLLKQPSVQPIQIADALLDSPLPNQEELCRADGSLLWVCCSKTLSTIDGETFVDGLVEDITERKYAEVAQQESEERFRLIADTTPVFLWMADTNQRCYFFNKSWLNFTGQTLAQAMGTGWLTGVHPEDRLRYQETYDAAFQAHQGFKVEYRLRRFDGQYCWVLDSGTPRFTSDGTFVGYIGSCVDISDRKQLEDALRWKASELEEANRLKDEFLSSLSHELRTPLNSILGWSQMLRSRKVNEATAVRALEAIERNAKLQARLVEDILDVSRILEGRFRIEAYPTQLIPVIKAALESVQATADAKTIHLQSTLDSTVGTVLGDPNRLQQIVWNLLSNSIKFTPQNGQVEVSLTQAGTYAQIRVSDTGIGISADFLPYVFDRFRQADSSTTRPYGGLGLGLAIVRHLVELHGGVVQAQSTGTGQGATFTVHLPLIPERIATDRAGKPLLWTGGKLTELDAHKLNSLQVLVVDDEEDVRELLKVVLQQYGMDVTTVGSAAAALESIQQSVPDLLISDIGMPQENGYTLIRKIRALPPDRGGKLRAIALTAYAREEDRQQSVLAGFQRHISKPVETEELIAVIANLVR